MLVRRLTSVFLVMAPTILWGGAYAAAKDAAISTPVICTALTFTLQPGALSAAGGMQHPAPKDMPLDPVVIDVPLASAAEPSHAPLRFPPAVPPIGTDYVKTAVAEYSAPTSVTAATAWYRRSFAACGYRVFSWGKSSGPAGRSSHVTFQSPTSPRLWVELNFEKAPAGGTLLLYYAYAVTLPPRPANSYLSSSMARATVSYLFPGRTSEWRISITDQQSLVDLTQAINGLSSVDAFVHTCFGRDRGAATVSLTPKQGKTVTVKILPNCRDVIVGKGPTLVDDETITWTTVSLVAYRYCHAHRCVKTHPRSMAGS